MIIENRTCFKCEEKIDECMGFVSAQDFMALSKGSLDRIPRELCGKCGLLALFNPEPYLNALTS